MRLTPRFFALSILFASTAFWLSPRSYADNLVVNGGFEQTVSASNISGLNPASWTVVSPSGYTFDNCGQVTGASLPHSGSCAMNFGAFSSESISQILPTVAGDTYTVSFYLGDFITNMGATDNQFSVDFGTTNIFSVSDFPVEAYQLITETVMATGSATTLSFSGYDVPDSIGLDDVSVSTIPTGTTPEPSSIALLVTGMLGVAGVVKRRFANAGGGRYALQPRLRSGL